jgi:hypothetical protein
MAFPVPGLGSLRGAPAPLTLSSSSPLKEEMILRESLKGRSPFNNYNSPSPYQGEGDKGDRVINYP